MLFDPQMLGRVCKLGAETPLTAAQRFGFGASGRAHGMLIRSNARAIETMNILVDLSLGIGLLWYDLKETLPDTSFLPAIEATRHRAPTTITFREIAPRGNGT
jgi:hypothetical protein